MQTNPKTIVITGASSGIGAATAKQLVSQGNRIVLAARNNQKLTAISNQFTEEQQNNTLVVATDVVNADAVAKLAAQTIERFGRIDVWINGAGIMPQSTFIEGRIDDWNHMIDVNIRGTLNGIHSALPIMRDQKAGQFINIASVAAHDTHPGGGVYSATKAAVWMISEALRQEEAVAKSNVRVTVVSPGAVNTGLLNSVTDANTKKAMESYYDNYAIAPERIAQAITDTINLPADSAINEVVIRPTSQV
ncbi:SDR family oxidoreductase [Lactobacillus sp. Sy-1]|uniref:SDR family oxidoreductase n=1 Tax=Lactobacillus sp. Sy-1 TaxID=2109645 RepID=UPI001C561122|nr:SDR family oxidoreductase [Lactobacillus sp. Sy-1]MBW1605204.1 SDR family oxidoreductase [Lactobacillus sp. Sy-1]